MTGDKEKLQDMTKYKGGCMVVTVNNSRLSIAHVGTIVLMSRYSPHKVSLQDVYYVPDIKKNLISLSQLTLLGNYIMFSPQDVKVYQEIKISGTSIIEG